LACFTDFLAYWNLQFIWIYSCYWEQRRFWSGISAW